MFEPMVKYIPEGQKGLATVRHLHIGEQEHKFMVLREALNPGRYELSTPMGDYCQLFVKGEGLVMSDTRLEQVTNSEVVLKASGDVLIAGLGLGFILVPILAKKNVKSVTVVEKYQDVIDLISPNFKNRRLSILCADIYKWRPPAGATYNSIYFDIWSDICRSNLKDMSRLERRFRPRLRENGWMNSWSKAQCRRRW